MKDHAKEPQGRRGEARRPLSSQTIVAAGLAIASREGVDCVTMRRIAADLETSASALYVYVRSRDDLLQRMLDTVMAQVDLDLGPGIWRERLLRLLARSIAAARGHGGLMEIGLRAIPEGPHIEVITGRVLSLLREGGLSERTIVAALDLLALFVTAAALDRGPRPPAGPEEEALRLRNLEWQLDVLLTGLATSPEPQD